jgi:hypothetical protein
VVEVEGGGRGRRGGLWAKRGIKDGENCFHSVREGRVGETDIMCRPRQR